MAKITPIRIGEQFEHFLKDLKESFWGDLYLKTLQTSEQFWDATIAAGAVPPFSQTGERGLSGNGQAAGEGLT